MINSYFIHILLTKTKEFNQNSINLKACMHECMNDGDRWEYIKFEEEEEKSVHEI